MVEKNGDCGRDDQLKPPRKLVLVLLAILGGGLQTLSQPGPGWWPLCFVALIPLIAAVNGQRGRVALALGWVYGLAMSIFSLPWLADVLADYGGLGPVGGWLVLLILIAFLALFQGVFAWIITLRPANPLIWAVMGAIVWAGVDWFKNWIFTGFNWNPLGGPLVLSSEMGQAADLIGFYGLGFGVALVNFLLALAGVRRLESRKMFRWASLAVAIGLVGLWFGYGSIQHPRWEKVVAEADWRVVAVVQPSTDQAVKWDTDYRDRLLTRYQALADEAAFLTPWFVLWPETAMPFTYDYDAYETDWLNRVSREKGGLILTGVAGVSGYWPEQKLYNRMILLKDGQALAYYDKTHLVPFGEYLPLEGLPIFEWDFVAALIGAAGIYSPGQTRPPMEIPLDLADPAARRVKLGFLICFESIFPYLGRARVLEGAELLVVPTNDGWFGLSRAPEQHLWLAAMRAIETRRPVVRAGNTGISAVIYPSGAVPWQSELMDEAVFPLKTPVLKPGDLVMTHFVRWGYLVAPIMTILTGLLAVVRFFRGPHESVSPGHRLKDAPSC